MTSPYTRRMRRSTPCSRIRSSVGETASSASFRSAALARTPAAAARTALPSPTASFRNRRLARSGVASIRSLPGGSGIVLCAEEMERHVGNVAQHPRIVRNGRDVEQVACPKLHDAPVLERRSRRPRKHEPHVLHVAPTLPDGGTDVLGPLPARVVGGPADGHPSDPHQLEPALRHLP